jgi:hypothetical protein
MGLAKSFGLSLMLCLGHKRYSHPSPPSSLHSLHASPLILITRDPPQRLTGCIRTSRRLGSSTPQNLSMSDLHCRPELDSSSTVSTARRLSSSSNNDEFPCSMPPPTSKGHEEANTTIFLRQNVMNHTPAPQSIISRRTRESGFVPARISFPWSW